MAAETERVAERDLYLGFPGLIRDVIKVTFRIREFVVYRRRQQLIIHGQ